MRERVHVNRTMKDLVADLRYNMFIDEFSVTYKVTEEQKKEKKRHS